MDTNQLGFVIGKFLPFHRGHRHLVETAAANCQQLIVCVVYASWNPIPAEVRVHWIKQAVPQAQVRWVNQNEHGLDDWDTPGWAQLAIEICGQRPDVVFTSEQYGQGWAEAIGCRHHLVDLDRSTVPISGTEVRANPFENLHFLDPPVQQYFLHQGERS